MKTNKKLIEYQGDDKITIRKKIAEAINKQYENNKLTAYLELYGDGESFRYINKNSKARILSIDNNPKIGKKLKRIPGTRFISIQDLCEEEKGKFNVIWLDYCGTLSEESVYEDLLTLPKIMADQGMLYITLFMGRESQFIKGTPRDQMESGITSLINLLFMQNLVKVNREFTVKYISRAKIDKTRNKLGGSPMKLYKFTWEKIKEKSSTFIIKQDEFITPDSMY